MADIVQFVPKAHTTAAENLAEFIAVARDRLTVFGSELLFDEGVWDVSLTSAARGLGNKRHRISFSTLHTAAGKDRHRSIEQLRTKLGPHLPGDIDAASLLQALHKQDEVHRPLLLC